MEESRFFDGVISECSVTEYFTLYNELATQIGIFYDELFGLKSILRLIEAKKSPQKLLRDSFAEIDSTINNIRIILSNMRKQENPLIFAANVSANNQQLRDYIGFANLYRDRKAEIIRILTSSDNELTRLKNEIIDKIEKVNKRNIITRKWKEYKTDINKLNTEITHIDNTVTKYATQVDEKFGTNLIEIINS